jgi:site-specific DNA-methyltransferase (adenine-specific)
MNTPQKPQLHKHIVSSSVFLSDNLELIKTIESNTIDLIYCDILYGTGRKFNDYQDLKPIRTDIENHYIPRIKEMHRILKPTGSIYLQMDTRINHWIRCILDDIFGYDNFRNEIIWHYEDTMQGNSSIKIPKKHDNIYFYAKTNKHRINKVKIPLKIPKKRGNFSFQDGKLISIKGESLFNEKNIDSVWNIGITSVTSSKCKEFIDYATQKPKALIERIIKASSNEGDLVADFYLGSGTTAEVCKDLNRNFIGCDINPRAIEITLQRLNDAPSNSSNDDTRNKLKY